MEKRERKKRAFLSLPLLTVFFVIAVADLYAGELSAVGMRSNECKDRRTKVHSLLLSLQSIALLQGGTSSYPHLSRAKEAVEDLAEADAHRCDGGTEAPV